MARSPSDEERKLLDDFFGWFGRWLRERYQHLSFLIVLIPESFEPGEYVSASVHPHTEARDMMGCRKEGRFRLGYELPVQLADEQLTLEIIDKLMPILDRIRKVAGYVPREALSLMIYSAVMVADFNRAKHGEPSILRGTTPHERGVSAEPALSAIDLAFEPPVFTLDLIIQYWELGGSWILRQLKWRGDQVGRYFMGTIPPMWIEEKYLGFVFNSTADDIRLPVQVRAENVQLVNAINRAIESGDLDSFKDLNMTAAGDAVRVGDSSRAPVRVETVEELQRILEHREKWGDDQDRFVFCQLGEFWWLCYRDERALIADRKGMTVIRSLLAKPKQRVLFLVLDSGGQAVEKGADYATLGDKVREDELFMQAVYGHQGPLPKKTQERIENLIADHETAHNTEDWKRCEEIEQEIEKLWQKAQSDWSRNTLLPEARKPYDRVRQNVAAAIEAISKKMPKLGEHLDLIKIGVWCEYRIPADEAPPWMF